jgi:hypothetical protein
MTIQFWRQSLPKAEQIARSVEHEVNKQAVDMLKQLADQWVGENKLIHAGAAKRLADKLNKQLCAGATRDSEEMK